MKLSYIIFSPLILLGGILAGCQAVRQTIIDNPEISRAIVEWATIKFVKDHPTRAARVVEIANQVKAASSGEEFDTVETLMIFIGSKINWDKLAPEDQPLARLLLATISRALSDRIGTGKLTGPDILIVNDVANWIAGAASAYVVNDTATIRRIETRARELNIE